MWPAWGYGLWATCLVCAFGAHCPPFGTRSFRAACSNEPITPGFHASQGHSTPHGGFFYCR